ncbi:RbsD/FucU family protein [uncultured Pluralibacter sp.]|uniref:RbsD/FucU family protein n=1 Tax=uncultured Pluralibacter sp. TaxID=1490864 RepID=UPI002628B2A0|nr:RbsD/FucU family protein [uncultured Pluralibacter sp.]
MIKTDIIHPPLLQALAQCGHKSNILIADANYACINNAAENATRIYLNFAPGTVSSVLILEKLLQYINVERAVCMAWPDDFNNTIAAEYQALLPAGMDIEQRERADFYALAKSPDTHLVIASGETRRFANLLLTVAPVIV